MIDPKDGWQLEYSGNLSELEEKEFRAVVQLSPKSVFLSFLEDRVTKLESEIKALKAIEQERWGSGIEKFKKVIGE